MFNGASVFILCSNGDVFKLDVEEEVQAEIIRYFSEATIPLLKNNGIYEFDGNYKPENDERLKISHFEISDKIKNAIRNPIGVNSFSKTNGSFPSIKAIFVGKAIIKDGDEYFQIGFQLFRKNQYLTCSGRLNLFFTSSTFKAMTNYGICISDSVECVFFKGELIFKSFYYARQIFDLTSYYRSATDKEVNNFLNEKSLYFENANTFRDQSNMWVRRRIARINDFNILNKYTPDAIIRLAKSSGIEILKKDNKLYIPSDKAKIKTILGFLDEETYKGVFTNSLYLANSKRKIE